MKKLMSILVDPYLHLVGIGFLILAASALLSEAEQRTANAHTVKCTMCGDTHEGAFSCVRVVSAEGPRSPLEP
jgi:hypothetical protein